MKKGLAGALALFILVFAGVALSASSFSDVAGDDNAAPDVTNVTVSESPDGVLTFSVAVANYAALPANSWFNIWFDLDSDQSTGAAGDEAVITYLSDGAIHFFVADGPMLVEAAADGMSGHFEAGVLTLTVPRSALGDMSSFGILAVSARGQPLGDEQLIATDFAPDSGRSPYVSPGQAAFPDPASDQAAAPDVTSVRVSDAKNGTISFAISTSNFTNQSYMRLDIDSDDRTTTGGAGAEVVLVYQAGEVSLARWQEASQEYVADEPPTRAQGRNANGVVILSVNRSELGEVSRFGFAVVAGHLDADDLPDAVDFAPESRFFKYSLVNKPAVRLIVGKTVGAPARPRAGKPFTVSLPVRRSDTNRVITSGVVRCNVTAAGSKVPAAGRVRAGRAQCTFVVPQNASAVRGSLTVRSGGTTVTARFSFKVR